MRFIFFTDIHLLQNEDSILGFEKCLQAMLMLEPQLLINGGDLGMTPEAVTTYHQMIADVPMPIYQVNGNHEMCNQSLPREKAGQFCESFDFDGVHFILLDVVRYFEPTENHPHNWHVIADEANLRWLSDDLSQISKEVPVILVSHVPLSTSFPFRFGGKMGMEFPTNEVANADRVTALLQPFENVATLHGHDHENCRHNAGRVQILTTGAVAGGWWAHGLNSPNVCGEPQGFRVIDVDDSTGKIQSRYVAFQPEQDVPAALYVQNTTGICFINVFDASPQTKVQVDRLGYLQPLYPFDDSSKVLSPHMYQLPSNCSSRLLSITIEFEDGRIEEIELNKAQSYNK